MPERSTVMRYVLIIWRATDAVNEIASTDPMNDYTGVFIGGYSIRGIYSTKERALNEKNALINMLGFENESETWKNNCFQIKEITDEVAANFNTLELDKTYNIIYTRNCMGDVYDLEVTEDADADCVDIRSSYVLDEETDEWIHKYDDVDGIIEFQKVLNMPRIVIENGYDMV